MSGRRNSTATPPGNTPSRRRRRGRPARAAWLRDPAAGRLLRPAVRGPQEHRRRAQWRVRSGRKSVRHRGRRALPAVPCPARGLTAPATTREQQRGLSAMPWHPLRTGRVTQRLNLLHHFTMGRVMRCGVAARRNSPRRPALPLDCSPLQSSRPDRAASGLHLVPRAWDRRRPRVERWAYRRGRPVRGRAYRGTVRFSSSPISIPGDRQAPFGQPTAILAAWRV